MKKILRCVTIIISLIAYNGDAVPKVKKPQKQEQQRKVKKEEQRLKKQEKSKSARARGDSVVKQTTEYSKKWMTPPKKHTQEQEPEAAAIISPAKRKSKTKPSLQKENVTPYAFLVPTALIAAMTLALDYSLKADAQQKKENTTDVFDELLHKRQEKLRKKQEPMLPTLGNDTYRSFGSTNIINPTT